MDAAAEASKPEVSGRCTTRRTSYSPRSAERHFSTRIPQARPHRRHAAHLPRGRSIRILYYGCLACQTTAGAIPPEVLKRKRYFGLGDDKAEVWDPEAAREADEHTARCANEGTPPKVSWIATTFVSARWKHRASRRWRVTQAAGATSPSPPPRANHAVDAGEDVRPKTAAAAAAASIPKLSGSWMNEKIGARI